VVLLVPFAALLALTWSSTRPGAPAAVPEAGLTPAEARTASQALLHQPPVQQRPALADGRVTDAEYRDAVERSMTCLEAALLDANPSLVPAEVRLGTPTRTVDGFTYTFHFSVHRPVGDPRPLDRRCQERFSSRVESLFHLQRRADPAFMAAAARSFHGCLDRAGLPATTATGPRARFLAVLADPSVDEREAVRARRCLGDHPSIGDLDL
jgi:hypothetical protein